MGGGFDDVVGQAGLYDTDGTMLCSWEESGIDVETDYTINTYETATTSPYYVITNNYPNTKKVVIPESVTSIGGYSFYNCNSLTEIVIPEGVTSIGNSSLANCTNLTSITIPEGVTSIGNSSLANCANLTSITIPESVTSIENFAFSYCFNLTSITIPEGITSIGVYAFQNCTNLTSVTFENPNNWYQNNTVITKDLSDTSVAATCLVTTYMTRKWTRQD